MNDCEKPEYEDFVTVKPELVKILSKEQMDLAKEHLDILRELINSNLTVKEIHALFWDSSRKEYTKTIKTIYRYMDALEENGLVKVAGHRKPSDSRMTEKLYCRSAMVFTQEEEDKELRWYETDEGKVILQDTSNLILRFFEVPEEKKKDVENLLAQYYSNRDKIVENLLQRLANDEDLAKIMEKIGMGEFKGIASLLGILGVLRNHPEFQEQVKITLS